MRRTVPIKADAGSCIFAAVFLLTVPLRVAAAFLVAVSVHELGHLIALKLTKAGIQNIRFRLCGIQITTEEMSPEKEMICALAGPVSGLLLVLAARYMPYTALFALFHSVFNLLPIYPLDGGRALRSILRRICGSRAGIRIFNGFEMIALVVLTFAALYLICRYRMCVFILFLIYLAVIKRNGRKNTLQTTQTNSTIIKNSTGAFAL